MDEFYEDVMKTKISYKADTTDVVEGCNVRRGSFQFCNINPLHADKCKAQRVQGAESSEHCRKSGIMSRGDKDRPKLFSRRMQGVSNVKQHREAQGVQQIHHHIPYAVKVTAPCKLFYHISDVVVRPNYPPNARACLDTVEAQVTGQDTPFSITTYIMKRLQEFQDRLFKRPAA